MEGPFSQLASNFVLFSGKKNWNYFYLILAFLCFVFCISALIKIYEVPHYSYGVKYVNEGDSLNVEKFHLRLNFLKTASTSLSSPEKVLDVEFKLQGDSDIIKNQKPNYSVSIYSSLQDFNGSNNIDLSTKPRKKYYNETCSYLLNRKDQLVVKDGANYCDQLFNYRVTYIAKTPIIIQRKMKSKLSEFRQLYNKSRLFMPEDISKGVFNINMSFDDNKCITKESDVLLSINFGGPCDFSDIYPEPDQKHIDKIVYNDIEKIKQICNEKGGLRFFVKYPDLENMQSGRVFFLTTVLSLLLAFICKFIFDVIDDRSKRKKLKKASGAERLNEDTELILVKYLQKEEKEDIDVEEENTSDESQSKDDSQEHTESIQSRTTLS